MKLYQVLARVPNGIASVLVLAEDAKTAQAKVEEMLTPHYGEDTRVFAPLTLRDGQGNPLHYFHIIELARTGFSTEITSIDELLATIEKSRRTHIGLVAQLDQLSALVRDTKPKTEESEGD